MKNCDYKIKKYNDKISASTNKNKMQHYYKKLKYYKNKKELKGGSFDVIKEQIEEIAKFNEEDGNDTINVLTTFVKKMGENIKDINIEINDQQKKTIDLLELTDSLNLLSLETENLIEKKNKLLEFISELKENNEQLVSDMKNISENINEINQMNLGNTDELKELLERVNDLLNKMEQTEQE